jgi:outer membrane lipoprotein-sorting protein
MNRQDIHEDLLEQAIRAMREAPAIGELPKQQLLKSIAASRDAAARQPHWVFQRIRAMKPLSKLAASVLLVFGLAAVGWALFHAGPALAFEAVAQQLREAKTLSGDLIAQQPQLTMTSRFMYLAPGHLRVEMTGGLVEIVDHQAGQILLLNEPQKSAITIKVDEKDPKTKAAAASVDWIETLRNISRDAGKSAGEKEVDGVRAKEFTLHENGQQFTIFAEAKTGAPLRVEGSIQMGDQPVTVVLDHIVLGQSLAMSLFTTDIPMGYAHQQTNMSAEPLGEDDLVKFLADYSARNEVFAPSLKDIRKDTGLGSGLPPKGSKNVTPELLQIVTRATRATLFVRQLPANSDWHYAGAGVKKGDSAKPIFWYHPGGAASYRVIYADLHIEEVPATAVPSDPNAESQASK